jgi:hypothetical protein
MMLASLADRSIRRHWFRRLGRMLVLVTQLVALVAPLAEAHEDRLLDAHVEAPRTVPHPGHHPDSCPACMLLSVHGCPVERPRLEPLVLERNVVAPLRATSVASRIRIVSNSSRAPPRPA